MPSLTPPVLVLWPWSQSVARQTLEDLQRGIPQDTETCVLDRNDGFAAGLNAAARTAGRADLAIVADRCKLPGGWLERLRSTACADDTIAAATVLVIGPGEPPLTDLGTTTVAAHAEQAPTGVARPVHPRVFRVAPVCAYIRRSALDLLGPFEESFEHPAAVLAEFSARALSHGLSCVLADDVRAERLTGGLPPCPSTEMDRVLAAHPWFDAVLAEEDALELGPLRHSLVAAQVGGGPPSVTIDARALGPTPAGTQTYVGGLVLALARSGQGTVRAVVRDDAPPAAVDELEAAGVEVMTESEVGDEPLRTAIAHRPQQAFVPEDIRLLRRVGERVVISHLDLIGYRNPTYHASTDEWRRYRRLTRVALAAADRVVLLSAHARADAIAEELIEPEYTSVCGVGVDPEAPGNALRPARVPEGRALLAMIGSDYMHKNRLFALELVSELRRLGWDGMLVLAGAHVAHGGSAQAEAKALRARPDLAERVLDIGSVSEPEKRWLLRNAAALLCPSTYEGFGLTPLEAAAAGTPCLYALVTSLEEVAGADAATLVPWDARASAERALPLLHAGEARDCHLASLRAALGRYRWESVVGRLAAVYREAIASPYRSSVPRSWEELEREQLIVLLDSAYHELRERTEHGRPLIDERGGALSHQEQRGLMRIAARRWLRGPVLGSIGLLGRSGRDAVPRDSGPSSR